MILTGIGGGGGAPLPSGLIGPIPCRKIKFYHYLESQ